MEFVAATNNPDKLEEIKRIMQAQGHTIISLEEAGLDIYPEETGETFAENALIKAKAVCEACGIPTIADDSGLCVDYFDGAPGVRSARFAGVHATTESNNRKLLKLLERMPFAKRTAQFVCVIALVMPNGAAIEVEGICEGVIGFGLEGDNGFGYDPLFIVGDYTFANMPAKEKDTISHRAVAMRRLIQELPAFLNTNEVAPVPLSTP